MRQSLVGLLNFWKSKHPSKIALYSPLEKITYKQLWDKSIFLAKKLDIKNSNKIVIAAKDKINVIIAVIASMMSKKDFLIIDSERVYFNDIIRKFNTDMIVVDEEKDVGLNTIDMCNLNDDYRSVNLNTIDVSIGMDDVVGSFLSSGSTGIPKIFSRTNYSLISEAFLWIFELQLNSGSSIFLRDTLSYIGCFVLMYSILYAGGTLFIEGSEKFSHEINVSYVYLSAFEINRIVNIGEIKSFFVRPDVFITMGAPIDYNTKLKLANIFKCDVIEMWGNSEGLATLISLKDKKSKQGSIGRATFTDELFVVDRNGNHLLPGNIGYIAGITDNDTTNGEGNIIISEDIGYMDNDGYFYLLGRENNVVILEDNDYFSSILMERDIKERCHLLDCVVFLDKNNNSITIFVTTRITDNIIEECKKYINKFKDKISINKITYIDKIPYTSNGKIDYLLLKSMINK